MLTHFSVRNYMGFPDVITWDLSHPRDYSFNTHLIRDGVIKNGIIYGINGSGKTSLGKAVFDIVSLENNSSRVDYSKVVYQGNPDAFIDFEYRFQFDGACALVYSYSRNNQGAFVNECLLYDDRIVFKKENKSLMISDEFPVEAGMVERLADSSNSVSILKFIVASFPLSGEHYLMKLMSFIRSMLWFRCLDERNFIGIDSGTVRIEEYIIKNNYVDDFARFLLEESGQTFDFSPTGVDDKSILCRIGNNVVPFLSVISTGTSSLELLFYWIKRMKESGARFVFIDEFDAFYHFDLSLNVCRTLFNEDFQVFMSSHNTMLLSNDLLRPDCAFEIRNHHIAALSERTDRGELRQGHNIEKMYRAGAFK